MPFLIIVKVCNVGHVFPHFAISASNKGEDSVFLTLVPLLIQTSMLFLFFLSLFIGGLAVSDGQRVR